MSLTIRGLGTALPPGSIPQDHAADLAGQFAGLEGEEAHRLSVLYRWSGVRKRHFALIDQYEAILAAHSDGALTTRWRMEQYDREARGLARHAAQRALDEAGIAPRAITHLVTVSCTGFAAPGVDIHLIKCLGLASTVERTCVGFMGCHGALNGLRVAHAFAASRPDACVLLCAVELCSLHFRAGWAPESTVPNALFADGAAAIVGTSTPSKDPSHWRMVASGSFLTADTEDAMTWHIGDHGFEMTLSTRVPDLIRQHLRPWLEAWLGRHGLQLSDIASWAVHPGGPRVLQTVECALELDERATADSRAVLAACGNMSSPTVLFILERLRHSAKPLPCVALGFGPGLVLEATLFAQRENMMSRA
jgi:predicted naringenin-chalcone synthase